MLGRSVGVLAQLLLHALEAGAGGWHGAAVERTCAPHHLEWDHRQWNTKGGVQLADQPRARDQAAMQAPFARHTLQCSERTARCEQRLLKLAARQRGQESSDEKTKQRRKGRQKDTAAGGGGVPHVARRRRSREEREEEETKGERGKKRMKHKRWHPGCLQRTVHVAVGGLSVVARQQGSKVAR